MNSNITLSPSNKFQVIGIAQDESNKIIVANSSNNNKIFEMSSIWYKVPFGFFNKNQSEWLWALNENIVVFIDLDICTIFSHEIPKSFFIWWKIYPNYDGTLIAIKGDNLSSSEIQFYDISDPSLLKKLEIENINTIEIRNKPEWITNNHIKISHPEQKYKNINGTFWLYDNDGNIDEIILEKDGDIMKLKN